MFTTKRFVLISATVLATFAIGCGSTAATGPAGSNAVAEPLAVSPAAVPRDPHGEHMPGLPFFGVAEHLALSAEQRTKVDAIRTDFKAKTQPAHAAGIELANILATGLEKGAVDDAAATAQAARVADAVKGQREAIQDAVQKLHDALTPAQRQELVNRMRDHHKGMREHGKGMHGMAGPGKGPDGMFLRLHALAGELGLTAEQKEAFRSAITGELQKGTPAEAARHGQFREHLRGLGDAFVQDSFDAKKADVGAHAPEMADVWTKRLVTFTETAVRILTPEQRAKLAQHIRAKAQTHR